jgi:PTS system nitrogen regulatory IIA component
VAPHGSALLGGPRLSEGGEGGTIGDGIAIPNVRVAALAPFFSLLARLEKPIDFDAGDGRLGIPSVIPTNADAEHLAALASASRCLRNQRTTCRLRTASEPNALYNVLAATASRSGRAAGRT